jgi:6-pyruvoyltetrahydropterin/6-carboxytetrahydropterin synthase
VTRHAGPRRAATTPATGPAAVRHIIAVSHTWEAAHRLPQLGGKCASLHGHSWWVDIAVSAPELTPLGTVVEFGEFKARLRGLIDGYLDHGSMLGRDDPLTSVLIAQGCKVFVFGDPERSQFATNGQLWPTVEEVAGLLYRLAGHALAATTEPAPGAYVSRVRVRETQTNSASVVATPAAAAIGAGR